MDDGGKFQHRICSWDIIKDGRRKLLLSAFEVLSNKTSNWQISLFHPRRPPKNDPFILYM